MLPRSHKLSSPVDFRRTIKLGKRTGGKYFVTHVRDRQAESPAPVALTEGPRFGLVVSKSVGNAVTRHATSRRLRHAAYALIPTLPTGYDIVLRALPAAAGASTPELQRQLERAVEKLQKRS
ncbi:ribonuclease P protein component [Corynebacterium tapiri]|uniref:Ribonuclease P protein component n=1 Tax=Corynebacterium tapiri TaxID=1448266 RepID=A0A5C4U2X7_9CORY|nr:ribonuclease P protein component [Corynebacterium tapiri]TNL96858.1 ribonuclease P protein component [Corynebacterium tapiri]